MVVEFTFEGEVGNLVHYNLTLVRADSAEEAYSKSLRLGAEIESTYTNSEGKLVTVRFRGLRNLYVISDDLEDGAELLYQEQTNVSEEQLLSTIKNKEALCVFEPWVPPS